MEQLYPVTLSEQLDRLERICALIRAVYAARTDEEFLAARARIQEALEEP